jgi:hypothetical protein
MPSITFELTEKWQVDVFVEMYCLIKQDGEGMLAAEVNDLILFILEQACEASTPNPNNKMLSAWQDAQDLLMKARRSSKELDENISKARRRLREYFNLPLEKSEEIWKAILHMKFKSAKEILPFLDMEWLIEYNKQHKLLEPDMPTTLDSFEIEEILSYVINDETILKD